MKKITLCALCFAGIVCGCSGHAETATESTTSGIEVRDSKKDEIAQWVAAVQKDTEVLSSLNAPVHQGARADVSEACEDAAVRSVLERRGAFLAETDGAYAQGIEILRSVPDTGAAYVPKHLAEIEALAASVQSGAVPAPFEWTASDSETLVKNLKAVGFSTGPDEAAARASFVAMLKGPECGKILPRYCEYVSELRASQAGRLETEARLDALLACDLSGWAGALRLDYPQNDYKFDRFRKYVSDEAIANIRKEVFLEDMARRGVKKAFEAIEPPDSQYRALLEARKIYVAAIENGGWPKVEAPAKIEEAKLGKSYAYVPGLRRRLQAEGYGISDVESDVMDQPLVDAVLLYRDVHQLSPKKVIDQVLFKNMAVPPETRLETIDLTLQRYREAAVGSLNYYVKVNVPDFHVEVWKDGERQARHRIVVGNDKLQLDPVTKKPVPDPETLYPLHPNRTPLQTSKINEVIYQPYWNVPARIRIEELEPKLAENPNYYAEHNYEEVNVGDPKLYYVRELPNPKNSLGKVKLMFPNPHNTYLHDTPAKGVFNQPMRALSHGCMRVQNPLDLAELILKNDGQWNKSYVDGILRADPAEQVTIELKRPVDVDVVYFNARVDDSGVVAFLSDIYQYDAVRLGKVVLKKLPRPKDWPKR
ncbi:MAG: L,D-transpeptidase family protein [Proteobacteria bacterium]|nr:L,D-transpeptidase family protein [Pseudomonadota bacterium]